ncbi:hypothetical protein GON26_08940 [Flavobacterium sp. GA093]|uniref:Glycosyltransferase RgtA/B/C/D-like domain-containing protein n=1 Tax=Flavobacterium hydrocarbonoxydans TaxID=2683249 RepID=A0A6I4NJB9_9FLAO|nr:hypothetical protein [Flavobacterium hydrocarbonoxydans]MWB94488.1 hypothetical protein [Flavobacterium hydrocarbonoxydans]
MLIFFINIVIISLIDLGTLISFTYTIAVFYLFVFFFKSEEFLLKNFFVIQLYILLAIILFQIQKFVMSDWYGFSGDYGGIGTDDSRFYGGVTTNVSSIPYGARSYQGMEHSFVTFLKYLYPFQVNHPLSIIIPNLLGICFIPHFTYKAALALTKDIKVSEIAFKLVLVCPFILSNGLILMRDGWTAFFMILGLYHFFAGNIIKYIITLFCLMTVRVGSGVLLLVVPFFYMSKIIFSGNVNKVFLRIVLGTAFCFVFIIVGLPFLLDYLVSKGISGFAREEFVENFIAKADDSSIIYSIYNMPMYLKLPIGFVFFLFLPFTKIEFFTQGVFNARSVMFTTIMPILQIFYFKYFFSGIFYAFRKNEPHIKKVVYIYGVLIIIISQLSIQPRHKTGIMPFFYILVAYGIVNNNKLSNQFGSLIMAALILMQMFILLK